MTSAAAVLAVALGLAAGGDAEAAGVSGQSSTAIIVITPRDTSQSSTVNDSAQKAGATGSQAAAGGSTQPCCDGFGNVEASTQDYSLHTSAQGLMLRGSGQAGTTTIREFAKASLSDTLTIDGVAADINAIQVHKTLTLSQTLVNFEAVFTDSVNLDIERGFTLQIDSDGIGGSPLSGGCATSADVFGCEAFTFDTHDPHELFMDAPQTVDFTLDFTRDSDGVFRRTFSTTMTLNAGLTFDQDRRLSDGARVGFLPLFDLSFDRGLEITDAGGNALCGLDVATASGLNFGSVGGCPGGGGGGGGTGGGGGGGGGTGGAGVPEPASWALMIAGFGFVGAAMRRRRARATIAA